MIEHRKCPIPPQKRTKFGIQAIVRTEIAIARSLQAHDFLADPIFDRVMADEAMGALTGVLLDAGELSGTGAKTCTQGTAMQEALDATRV